MSDSIADISEEEFESEVLQALCPVVVDFWAPWCGPCRAIAPELEKLADLMGDSVKFVKVNIDNNRELAFRHGVMSVPTVVKFHGGGAAARAVGTRSAAQLRTELGLV